MGGRDRSAYGAIAPTHNGSWKKKMLDELPSLRNHTRVVFTGLMSYENYRLVLHRTDLHCYFTAICYQLEPFQSSSMWSPTITNRSEATTGTIDIPRAILLRPYKTFINQMALEKLTYTFKAYKHS